RAGHERRPGPDLLQLIAGSEGTLAIVTDATLSVQPLPTARSMRAFRLKSVDAGLEAMRLVVRAGMRPQLLRLYDPLATQLQSDRGGPHHAEVSTPVRAVLEAVRAKSLGYVLAAPKLLNRAIELLPERCLLLAAFEGESQGAVED